MRPIRPIYLKIVAVAAAAVVAVATIVALAVAGGAQATAHREIFVQFNLCGNACGNGGLGIVTQLTTAIRERRPFAITLNEVCENQYARLRSDLDAYQGRFDPTGPTCHNGARYGNAILLRTTDATLVGGWDLPNPAGDESRRLLCLSTRLPAAPVLIVCVTHISNVSGNVGAQVRAVAGIVRGLDSADAVVLAGDFNADPVDPWMNPLYGTCDGAGSGVLREVDSAGCQARPMLNRNVGGDIINEHTYNQHKYDYIFVSDRDWSAPTAEAVDIGHGLSDHEALWATATLV